MSSADYDVAYCDACERCHLNGICPLTDKAQKVVSMTDAGWAAGKDIKEPGWYWWDEKGLPIKAVQIEKGFTFSKYASIGRDVMYVVGYGGLLEDKPGLFLGPISPSTILNHNSFAVIRADVRQGLSKNLRL